MNDALHQQDFWTPHALELWESFGQMPWGSNWNLTSCCQRSAGKSPLQLSYIEMNFKQESIIHIHVSGTQINTESSPSGGGGRGGGGGGGGGKDLHGYQFESCRTSIN